jgi:DNA-binding protein HU-beta
LWKRTAAYGQGRNTFITRKPFAHKGFPSFVETRYGQGFRLNAKNNVKITTSLFLLKPLSFLILNGFLRFKIFAGFKKQVYLPRTKIFTMNKAELIAKIADDAGITKTQANESLDSFVEAVAKTLKGGGKVTLVGFGTFSVSKRAARNGRNPQTGAVIKIKAKKVAKFKAGKELSGKL